mmetsp:Transcript_6381/g.14426  ORF Transcript_6381/g.14426 Transcript_6381/m.14426 type:complete len:245 (-) Transcript_6381:724-1458(-)
MGHPCLILTSWLKTSITKNYPAKIGSSRLNSTRMPMNVSTTMPLGHSAAVQRTNPILMRVDHCVQMAPTRSITRTIKFGIRLARTGMRCQPFYQSGTIITTLWRPARNIIKMFDMDVLVQEFLMLPSNVGRYVKNGGHASRYVRMDLTCRILTHLSVGRHAEDGSCIQGLKYMRKSAHFTKWLEPNVDVKIHHRQMPVDHCVDWGVAFPIPSGKCKESLVNLGITGLPSSRISTARTTTVAEGS